MSCLARESEILHLHFWNAAFEMLKKSGAIQTGDEREDGGLLGDAMGGGS